MVDELLNSSQYGEKMAAHWLDVARYSDSYGYQDDNVRTQWSGVTAIHAFNKIFLYDQFLTWQIAGDMLPDALRNKYCYGFFPQPQISGRRRVYRKNTALSIWLIKQKLCKRNTGVTLEVQCHDHKYDPTKKIITHSCLLQ